MQIVRKNAIKLPAVYDSEYTVLKIRQLRKIHLFSL